MSSGNHPDGGAVTRVGAAFRPGPGRVPPTAVALAACFLATSIVVAAALAAEPARSLPSAAEEARLRSACAASGERILAVNTIRSAAYQEQFTRYNPQTNRCYVEMRVQTLAFDERADRFARFLYDGQTKELHAFAQINDAKKSGRVFDLNHHTISFENGGWDDAIEYIYAVMADDR